MKGGSMTANQINYWKLQEEKRANAARELETHRANLATERENKRSNRAREYETNRANLAQEALKKESNVINANFNAETQRSHLAQERLTSVGQETDRARVALGYVQDATNRLVGLGNVQVGMANVAELTRSNIARQDEINRSNLVHEAQLVRSTDSQVSNAFTNAGQLSLETTKWNQSGSDLQQQQIANYNSQTYLNYAKSGESMAQSKATPINVISNLAGSIGKWVAPVISKVIK